ncbi:MAG: bacillithiol system redox-active protein YtxJ [Ferruginibacter sp.]|nr:bacillithiol system redox-active protein YtxJ [Ferruginibacter sp.]
MNWKDLTDKQGLAEIINASEKITQAIFKHSTRCSISTMAKSRLERETAPKNVIFNYLDLITYRNISNQIAADFNVEHESPQILIIKNGKCIYNQSHNAINMADIEELA